MFTTMSRASSASAIAHLLVSYSVLLQVTPTAHLVAAVSPGRLDKLTREELLRLDEEVSQFYFDSYADLDARNATFEEQLYKTIRSLRHTTVVNHYDFRYTSDDIKWRSMGSRVDRELCKHQLNSLVRIANSTMAPGTRPAPTDQLPLSVIDFFGASGQVGAGLLNGNFVWLGSATSCEHAKIPAETLTKYSNMGGDSELSKRDLKGRYCMAHLRATSWPKWDIYFEDRITIRRALCLPEACHTALYDQEAEIQRLVAVLARTNLLAPFNEPGRFEVSHLYCYPDEDSEFRQLNLGTKLFIAFVCLWALLTIWANHKYAQRRQALSQLRQTVDIRMIINDAENDGDDEAKPKRVRGQRERPAASETPEGRADEVDGERGEYDSKLLGGGSAGPPSACSSTSATPLPSDVDENDSDLNLIEPFRAEGPRRKKRRQLPPVEAVVADQAEAAGSINFSPADAPEPVPADEAQMDLVKALSIEANLSFLLEARPSSSQPERDEASARETSDADKGRQSVGLGKVARKLSKGAISRRTSSSNEALVKDLRESRGERESNVSIVAGPRCADQKADTNQARGRRVNIEILDGLKVIATSYIILSHTLMFFFGAVSDLRFAHERMLDLTMIAVINGLQIVGLFYIITGCLLTYLSFSKAKLSQLQSPLFWLLVLVGRYFRLIPPYALVFWFARHVAPYLGAGPYWWDYRTDIDHMRGQCANESWWVMWSMSAADIKIPNDCIPQAWYLSDDFRTLMVLPVFIFLLAKSARVGYAAIFVTIAVSTMKLGRILKAANIDYKILLNWHPHVYALMTDRLHDVYTDFLVRISTYLLGVILGHLLYLYETRVIRRWPKGLVKHGMKLASVMAACFFLGAPLLANPWLNQFLPSRDQLDSDLVVWLIPLFKSSMEVCICVILLLLVTGSGDELVRRLLGSRTMKILANLSYAVFLVHVEIMYKAPFTQYESHYWYLFLYTGFYIGISHVVAFFLYLFWEMPINNLTRNVFKRAFRATG